MSAHCLSPWFWVLPPPFHRPFTAFHRPFTALSPPFTAFRRLSPPFHRLSPPFTVVLSQVFGTPSGPIGAFIHLLGRDATENGEVIRAMNISTVYICAI